MTTNKTNQPTTEQDAYQVRIINPEIDKEMFDTMRAEDRLNVGAYSSPRVYVDNPTKDQYVETVTVELAHREALAEDEKRTFCTDFQKKAAALRSPDLESAFAKEVGAFLDELTNKGE